MRQLHALVAAKKAVRIQSDWIVIVDHGGSGHVTCRFKRGNFFELPLLLSSASPIVRVGKHLCIQCKFIFALLYEQAIDLILVVNSITH